MSTTLRGPETVRETGPRRPKNESATKLDFELPEQQTVSDADYQKQPGTAYEDNLHKEVPDRQISAERRQVRGVLDTMTVRAEKGRHTFTDEELRDRGHRRQQEDAYNKDVDEARRLMERNGGDVKRFDQHRAEQKEKFLDRRRAEEMHVPGQTVEELLQSVLKVPYLKAEFELVINKVRDERKRQEKSRGLFGRIAAGWKNFRHTIGNDFTEDSYTVMANVVKHLNDNPQDSVQGKHLLQALRSRYPN